MKKSEMIKKSLDALSKQIESITTEMLESTGEASLDKYKEALKQYDEMETLYQEALQEETLAEETPLSEKEKGLTRSEQKAALTEETTKWVTMFREAVTAGGRFSGTLPNQVSSMIQMKKEQVARLRNLCTVQSVGGEYTVLIDGDDVAVDYVDPSGRIAPQTAAVKALKLSALKLAGIAKISNEIIKDYTVDILAYIVDKFGTALAKKEDHEILLGAGTSGSTNKIRGIMTASSAATVNELASATITWDDIRDTVLMTKGYKASATVVISSELESLIAGMKDGDKYIFGPNGTVDKICGCKVVVSDQMPAPAPSTACMVVGDFSRYHIIERKGMEVTVLDQLYAETDQTGVRVIERIDGDFVGDAFVVMKTGAGA